MASVEVNLFDVLGLTSECLVELDTWEVLTLVEERYRTLAKIFHPDPNPGSDARFKKIKEARDSLQAEAFLEDALRSARRRSKVKKKAPPVTLCTMYVPPKRAQTEQERKEDTDEAARVLELGLKAQLTAFVQARQTFRIVQSVQDKNKRPMYDKYTYGVSAFNPEPCRMLIEEDIRTRAVGLSRARELRRQRVKVQSLPYLPMNFRELEIRADGSVWSYVAERVLFRPSMVHPPPGTPREWIHTNDRDRGHYFVRKEGREGSRFENTLIGSIPFGDYPIDVRPQMFAQMFDRGATAEDNYRFATEGFRFSAVSHLLGAVRPFFRGGDHLVAICNRGDEPLLQILGDVRSIALASPRPQSNRGPATSFENGSEE